MTKTRMQPEEIEAPAGEPFKYDRLNREKPAKILTRLISSIDGPCTLAIDAAWGAGKTSFLKMLAQHLRDDEFPVVEFNAWETDFTEVPFLALSAELTGSLAKKYKDQLPEKTYEEFEKAAKNVMWSVVSSLVYKVTAGTVDIDQLKTALIEKGFSEYGEERGQIEKFKGVLKETAEKLSEEYQGRPLVVMIDELDRCRPIYAVEFLETAKHLFAVDNIVFVLAVNRDQLTHSVRALYGNEFDAEKYLRRFFDVDFRLPFADRSAFISRMINAIHLEDYFRRTRDEDGRNNKEVINNFLSKFFQAADISLRDIAQAMHRMGLVFASLPDKYLSFPLGAATAVILRTIEPEIYQQFIRNEVSDEEVINSIFRRPEFNSFRHEYDAALFEATIILGAQEMRNLKNPGLEYSGLWKRREVEARDVSDEDRAKENAKCYAERVLNRLHVLSTNPIHPFMTYKEGFKASVERLELFSPDFISESESTRE